MNRHANIPPLSPSFIHSTRFPNPCGYGGAGESGKRAGVPPSHRSLIPPLLPCSQIPTTRQPIGSQNFSPGSGLSQSMSQPSPVSFRDSPSAPYDVALPPIPPRKAHRRAKSDIIYGLNSLMAQNSPRLIYPKPIEMPVGVESQRERKSHGDELLVDVSDGDNGNQAVSKTSSGVKRRAGKEIAPSTRLCRSVSMDSSLNGKSPMLPPSPGNLQGTNSNSVGGGVFTDSEMTAIVGSGKLKGLAASDPKHVKRILANRLSAARSKEKKAQYMSELEGKVQTLKTEAITMSAQYAHLERVKMVLENENKELRIRLHGMEQQAQLRDTLIEQLTGEVHRLKMATGEVSQNLSESDRSNMQSLDANMFQQLNINQLHQPQTYPGFE